MKFPLMRNNILREDLDAVIDHLKQDDPILTHGPNVKAFEEEWSKWLDSPAEVSKRARYFYEPVVEPFPL